MAVLEADDESLRQVPVERCVSVLILCRASGSVEVMIAMLQSGMASSSA